MFPQLPVEMERMIWKEYFNRHVAGIIECYPCIWSYKPSCDLVNLVCETGESGQIQTGHEEVCDSNFLALNFWIPISPDDCLYELPNHTEEYWDSVY